MHVCLCVHTVIHVIMFCSFVLYSGLHLAVIHSQPEVLDRLLYLMTKEPMLQSVVDEQNALYQVCVVMWNAILYVNL